MSQSITCGKCKKYIKFVSSGGFIDTDEMCNCSKEESKPTIADFFADDEVKKMIEKTKCGVVTIASLKKFMEGE